MANKKGLGRGLSALLADEETVEASGSASSLASGAQKIPIEFLAANPDQPRKQFDQSELLGLATSIKERGLIQPILVRRISDTMYQIVAGERRWRAAGIAKLHEVPVIIGEYSDHEVAEIALIENIQRQNLNPMEEARGYRDLMDRFDNTQDDIAKIIGKSRSHIANVLRLLNLETAVQNMVASGELSFGHARALVTSDQQLADAKFITQKGLSVREVEKMLDTRKNSDEKRKGSASRGAVKDADTKQLEAELSAVLGMKVQIDHKSEGKGQLKIRYADLDQLDQLCQRLGK